MRREPTVGKFYGVPGRMPSSLEDAIAWTVLRLRDDAEAIECGWVPADKLTPEYVAALLSHHANYLAHYNRAAPHAVQAERQHQASNRASCKARAGALRAWPKPARSKWSARRS
jgi:hypothetical protein